MKEDDEGLALASGRTGDGRVNQIVQLKAISQDEKAVVIVEDGFRKIPVLVPGLKFSQSTFSN